MNDYKDYYGILGLEPNASERKIEAAYQKITKSIGKEMTECRRIGDEQAEVRHWNLHKKAEEIRKAYSLLSNPAVRRDYKEMGCISLEKHGYFINRDGNVIHITEAQSTANLGAVSRVVLGGMLGGTDTNFGINATDAIDAQGLDCFTTLKLTKSELQLGAEKQVLYNQNVYCSACGGKGHEGNEAPAVCTECNGKGYITRTVRKFLFYRSKSHACEKCNGTGKLFQNLCPQCKGVCKIKTESSTMVKVPPGSIYGEITKIQNQGNEGNHGCFGDLYVQFVKVTNIHNPHTTQWRV